MSKGVSPVAELFTEAATFQSYLEVESALARAHVWYVGPSRSFALDR